MCERKQTAPGNSVLELTLPCALGSRRRRLWELGSHAYCPVLGVCLPIDALRRLVGQALDSAAPESDYELHCSAIAHSKRRSPVAERIQRELERRYALAVRQAAHCKTREALLEWWARSRASGSLPGALWAVLTHSRCDIPLEDEVLAEVHMLQHQVGAAQRVDLQRHTELLEQHGVLVRELASLQQRSTRVITEKTACIEHQAAELIRLRAELTRRDAVIADLREELQTLETASPALRTRMAQAQQIEAQLARLQELERQLLRGQRRALELQERKSAATAAPGKEAVRAAPAVTKPAQPETLRDKAVLCVGGRPASVPIYRQLVERTGGRFLHHDGGEENNPAQLDANLSAADVVICQTGCISHDAYWRVKDHCKRHGKQCLFVDKPSATGLARGLESIQRVRPCP